MFRRKIQKIVETANALEMLPMSLLRFWAKRMKLILLMNFADFLCSNQDAKETFRRALSVQKIINHFCNFLSRVLLGQVQFHSRSLAYRSRRSTKAPMACFLIRLVLQSFLSQAKLRK